MQAFSKLTTLSFVCAISFLLIGCHFFESTKVSSQEIETASKWSSNDIGPSFDACDNLEGEELSNCFKDIISSTLIEYFTSSILESNSSIEEELTLVIKIDQEGNQIWSKKYSDHGEVTDIAISTINGEVDGYLITGHNGGEKGGIDAIITKVSMDGSILWDELYGNPSGGESIFADLGRGNEKIIYDECWGIESMNDGGAVIACGTGTHCYEHKRNKKLFAQCEEDPRGTWRALLVRVDKDGNLLWERADSFLEEEEEDWIPDTASEYVTLTNSKNIVSILDLGFGYGIQVLDSE